jgi:hypothetical protein
MNAASELTIKDQEIKMTNTREIGISLRDRFYGRPEEDMSHHHQSDEVKRLCQDVKQGRRCDNVRPDLRILDLAIYRDQHVGTVGVSKLGRILE